jgi:hypothetical protein
MFHGLDSGLLLCLLQSGDGNSPWETIGTFVLFIVVMILRLGFAGSSSRSNRSALYEDSGLNSGCWFNMLPGTLSHRHHSSTHLSYLDDNQPGQSAFPEGLRQVYPPPAEGDAALPFGVGSRASTPPPARLPVIDRLGGEGLSVSERAFAEAQAGAAQRRGRYQQIQDLHSEMDERWRELIGMLEMLRDPAMSEGWQSLAEGPFGLNTALEQIRELLLQARQSGISTSRLVQCEAPLGTIQLVISNVRQAADPAVPEASRRRLRAGVLEFLDRDLPQIKRNLFGGGPGEGRE